MNAQVDRCAGQPPTDGAAASSGAAGRAPSGAGPAACDAPVSDLETMGEAAGAARRLVRRQARLARAIRGAVAVRHRAQCRHAAVRPHPMDRREPCADRAVPRLANASRERAADAR